MAPGLGPLSNHELIPLRGRDGSASTDELGRVSLRGPRSIYMLPKKKTIHRTETTRRSDFAVNLIRREGLVAELPSNLARGLSGRRDFGPRMGGTLSTHSTHSTLTTRASISTRRRLIMTSYTALHVKNWFSLIGGYELFNTRDVGSNLYMPHLAFFAYCTQCEVAHRTSAAE